MAIADVCRCDIVGDKKCIGMKCNMCGLYVADVIGRKDDKDKMRYSLMVEGMPKALSKVIEVLEHGAKKYDVHNWQKVENGLERYKEALYRHVMNMDGGLFSKDKDSGLLHLAHIACNALFLLELMGNENTL